jgi:hypothetical protein
MSCMHEWTDDLLRQQFPMSFIHGDFKRHREKCLFERERALLPDTQPLVSNYKLAKSLRSSVVEMNNRIRDLRNESNRLKRYVDEHWDTIYRAEFNGYRGTLNAQRDRTRVRQTFPCPAEDCRGFVDSESGLCGVCDTKICLKCGVVPEETHECDENMRLNFAAIKKQTKPCPNCSAPTFRIDGCMQMFCTHCHTPWDWVSGSIIRGVIHNPHYFEWLRSQSEDGTIPRQPGDQPAAAAGGPAEQRCEGTRVPSGYVLYQRLAADRRCKSARGQVMDRDGDPGFQTMATDLTMFCRRLIHIHEVTLPGLRQQRDDNADLRLQYLVNNLTEANMKTTLQRREKKRNKSREIADVYDMVCSVGGDLLWAYVREEKEINDVFESVSKIRAYVNTSLTKICQKFNMSYLSYLI